MLNNYILPVLHNRKAYGNRNFAVINGLMAVGVYNDNAGAFAEGLTNFNNSIRPYYYMPGDTMGDGWPLVGQPVPTDYFL